MRADVETLLIELYGRTVRWQTRNGIRVDLTQGEFIALWSAYRINKLETLLDAGVAKVRAYLRNPNTKPVCGWRTAEARETGVMSAANAKIMMAMDQRKMFQFTKGDKHRPESIEKMRKPKSEKTRAKMADAARARWAKEKNND